jgi:hypothetical protein
MVIRSIYKHSVDTVYIYTPYVLRDTMSYHITADDIPLCKWLKMPENTMRGFHGQYAHFSKKKLQEHLNQLHEIWPNTDFQIVAGACPAESSHLYQTSYQQMGSDLDSVMCGLQQDSSSDIRH